MKFDDSSLSSLAVVGVHAVSALLEENFDVIIKVWVASGTNNSRVTSLIEQAKNQSIAVELVKEQKLKEIAYAHQGIIAWARPPQVYDLDWLQNKLDSLPFLVALDGVTDCHNFGACLRSAEAAGVSAVLMPFRNTSALNSSVTKTSSGALYRIPLVRVNLSRAMDILKKNDYRSIGLSEHADKSLYDLKHKNKTLLVLGSEEKGLSQLVSNKCSDLVSIPCAGINSSLNVSVASGVAMFHLANNSE